MIDLASVLQICDVWFCTWKIIVGSIENSRFLIDEWVGLHVYMYVHV